MTSKLNRYGWMVIFFIGIFVAIWLEWQSETASPVMWFLVTGVWSAICGIGFTVMNVFVKTKPSTIVGKKTED